MRFWKIIFGLAAAFNFLVGLPLLLAPRALYAAASQEELMKVLDPKWPGPIPHTVLVAPGGEIIWRHNGVIDPKEAIAKIIEAMTPYYQPAPPAPAKAAPKKAE